MTLPDRWNAEWTELLTALCADDPARVGTVGTPDGHFTPVGPTRFDWLRGFGWAPAGGGYGLALIDLEAPGTVPAAAWETVCGPLGGAPPDLEGQLLYGEFTAPGTGRELTITLVAEHGVEAARARVSTIRIRVEPALVP
jgi:hypothetical protein